MKRKIEKNAKIDEKLMKKCKNWWKNAKINEKTRNHKRFPNIEEYITQYSVLLTSWPRVIMEFIKNGSSFCIFSNRFFFLAICWTNFVWLFWSFFSCYSSI